MGREIRMVPPNWEHPKDDRGNLQPMYERRFEDAAAEWKADFARWEAGERPDYADEEDRKLEFWEWENNPPERAYYRPWKDEEATWFQVWETVSEGTPVSPPFATREELAAYLVEHGDFWDQNRGHGGWGVDRATAFCAPGAGWAPSFAMVGGRLLESKDIPLELGQRAKSPANEQTAS